MNNTMKTILATMIVAASTTATAGIYSDEFASRYTHADGSALTTTEQAKLSTAIDSKLYSNGYTAIAVAAPLYEEIGVIGTALAQNESVHWSTLKHGAQLNAQGGWMLTALVADYAIKGQIADSVARKAGYKLTNFTDEVINRSSNFGTK